MTTLHLASHALIGRSDHPLAIRFGKYRTAGICGEAAGPEIILSWFFTTGYKLIVPIIALSWILIAERIEDDLLTTISIVRVAEIVAVVGSTSSVSVWAPGMT